MSSTSPAHPPVDEEDEEQLVRELIERFRSGDPAALGELFRHVYAELHLMASHKMRRQPQGHTLQPTALVNETFLKLFGREPVACKDKAHLIRASARAMGQILKDHARRKAACKREHGQRVELGGSLPAEPGEDPERYLEFDDEVERLARVAPRMARAMQLRFLLGFKNEDIAHVLGMPLRSFEREFIAASALVAARLR